jgi:hypothetical protein
LTHCFDWVAKPAIQKIDGSHRAALLQVSAIDAIIDREIISILFLPFKNLIWWPRIVNHLNTIQIRHRVFLFRRIRVVTSLACSGTFAACVTLAKDSGLSAETELAMAKGQKRSNRETKKPKQPKSVKTAAMPVPPGVAERTSVAAARTGLRNGRR